MSKRVRTSLRASTKGRSLRPKAVLSHRASLPPGEVEAFTPDSTDAEHTAAVLTEPASSPSEVMNVAESGAQVPAPAAVFTPVAAELRTTSDSLADALREASIQSREAAVEPESTDPATPSATETAAATETVSETETATAAETETETGPATAAANETETAAETETETGPATAAANETETAAATEPETATVTATGTEASTEIETIEADAKADRESEPGAERESEPGAVADEHPSGSVSAKAVESEDEEAAAAPRKEEDLDASGVSAEFFRDDEASIAPTIEDVPDGPRVVLSPATVARRARFRRVVAGVVAFAGVISLAVIGKAIVAPRRASAAPKVAVVAPAAPPPAPAPAPEPPKPEPAADTKLADAKKAEDKKADEAPADDDKKADDAKEAKADEKADDKKADDAKDDKKADEKADDKKAEPAGEPDPAAAKKLQQETLGLLNRGRSKDAAEKAREAIAADPTDAIGYLYLGSALQDSGRWKEGIEAYSDCVRTATKGSVNECKVMGGHK